MADDLMDFSEFDVDENDENADPDVEHAPTLMQTPVVKNSILKQSTKDNLIQLFTPVNKSRKLKVHFTPSIQTPSVNSNTSGEAPSVNSNTSEEAASQVGDSCSKDLNVSNTTSEEEEDRANWEERTTILTKQDHEDYCQYAKEFLLDIITNLPVKEEECSGDSGIEESMMEVQESMMDVQESQDNDTTPHNSQQVLPQPDSSQQPPAEKTETDECVDVLSEAADLLALLRGQTGSCSELPDTNEVPEPAVSSCAAEEANDCEDEPMDVDVSMVQPQPQEKGPTIDHDEIIATAEDDKLTKSPGKESLVPEMEPIDDGSDNEPKSHKSEESNIEQDINQVKDQIGNEETGSDVDIDLGTKFREEIDSNVENDNLKTQVVEIFDEGSEVLNKMEAGEQNPVSIVVTDAENVSSVVENAESEKVLVEEIENNKDLDDKNIVEKAKDHLEVNDQSSDEEFLSADEDLVSQEAKEPGLVDSPLRTPPKVGYNLDFDDLEAMNPFQTKVCVQNSPDLSGNDKQKLNSEKIVEKRVSKINEVLEAKQENAEVPKEVKELSSEINRDVSVCLANNKVVESNDNELNQNMGPDINAESNDQEMPLSCRKSEEPAQAQSPPLPKRGTYNLDDLDSMDPFKVKTQIMNSPAGCQRDERQATVDETDPFNPSKQIANLPVLKASKKETQNETPSQQNQSAIKNTEEDETEPSKPKIAKIKKTKPQAEKKESVINLPENLDELDPFKSGNQIMNSPPIKSGGCYEALPDDLDALDPFKLKKQMMTSPLSQEKPHSNVNNIDGHERKVESESKADDLLDNETLEPFKQMKNSPVANGVPDKLNDIDPFKPKKQILNSPDKQGACDVLPENLAGIDPFKPSNQMVNSPLKENVDNQNRSEIADEIDVFKSAKKIMDSPMAKAAIDESSFPTSLEDADPFKPKSQIANSPDKGLINLPENLDEIDPFQPRKQTLNSPRGGNDKDLPFDIDNIDPFKPKTQVPNSPDLITDLPDSFDDIDPFKPKNQMKNSPVSKEKNDLSDKTSETVKIDTEKASDAFDDIDPFKPKRQMQNSPKQALEDNLDSVNPFMSKNQLQNSPKKGLDDNFDSVDPFKPRQQMLNSPLGRRLKASSGTPKTVLSPFLNRNNRLPATPEETLSDDGEVMEVQGVTRRGAAGSTNAQGFDFDESEFVAASEVFKDPGVWEMLEQFGNTASTSSQDSALSRMSLYVKFDPLVEGTSRLSTNARRISIRPKQLEKVKEFGLEDTFLLLGTPPKKKRQSMNVSQLRHTPVSSNGVPAQGHKPRELNMEQGAVDLIMALSPEGDSLTPSSQRSQPTSLLPTLDDEEGGSGLFEELKYTNSDLRRFRNDLKLEFQGQLIVEKKEWSKKEQQYEDMLKEARAALEAKKKEVQEIAKACVMFEETVEKMKAKQEKEREETNNVNKENQQLREDIQGVENAFSDLHRRYEKLKMVVEGNLKNEDTLKKYASDLKEKLKSSEEKYTTLKKTAEEKITKSTQEIAKLKHEVSSDTNKHDAAKKVMMMKIESLERQLQQKIEENKNLTEICDQLIQKAEN